MQQPAGILLVFFPERQEQNQTRLPYICMPRQYRCYKHNSNSNQTGLCTTAPGLLTLVAVFGCADKAWQDASMEAMHCLLVCARVMCTTYMHNKAGA